MSCIPFNLAYGSEECIKFLELLQKVDDNALYTNLTEIIDYKWRANKRTISGISAFYIFYTMVLNYHTVYYRKLYIVYLMLFLLMIKMVFYALNINI